jgi:hypothetical protein
LPPWQEWGYIQGMAKNGKGPGRPKGTGRYTVAFRCNLTPELADKLEEWRRKNGAATLSDAVRVILGEKVGVRP